jgi:hypothetical protein
LVADHLHFCPGKVSSVREMHLHLKFLPYGFAGDHDKELGFQRHRRNLPSLGAVFPCWALTDPSGPSQSWVRAIATLE